MVTARPLPPIAVWCKFADGVALRFHCYHSCRAGYFAQDGWTAGEPEPRGPQVRTHAPALPSPFDRTLTTLRAILPFEIHRRNRKAAPGKSGAAAAGGASAGARAVSEAPNLEVYVHGFTHGVQAFLRVLIDQRAGVNYASK